MVKRHLKRLHTPRTWQIKRKEEKYVTRPYPSGHSYLYSVALNDIVKSLKIAKTTREVKYIVNNKEVLVDSHKCTDEKSAIGFMDVLSFPEADEYYRVTLSTFRKIVGIPIDKKEADKKICKITGKRMHKGKVQLTLHDGRTVIMDSTDMKVGDSVLIELPSQKIVSHIPFKEGSMVMFIKGRFLGKTGVVKSIEDEKVHVEIEGQAFETPKEFSFPVSSNTKTEITITV